MSVTRVTEKSFMATVVAFAKVHGWKVSHTYDSRRSEPGVPDLLMVRKGVLVFAELKTDVGVVSAFQMDWLKVLRETVNQVYVWRPSDWSEIEKVLGSNQWPLRNA